MLCFQYAAQIFLFNNDGKALKFKGGCNPITHLTLMDAPMEHKVHNIKKFGGGGPYFSPPPAGSAYSVWIDGKLRSHPLTLELLQGPG